MKNQQIKNLEVELEELYKLHFKYARTPEERNASMGYIVRRQVRYFQLTKAETGEGKTYFPRFRYILLKGGLN